MNFIKNDVSYSIRKRVEWIDLCKILACLSVIFFHLGHGDWGKTITTIGVPFFFIASGYFTKDDPGLWLNWRRFKMLFIPLIVWGVFYFILVRASDFLCPQHTFSLQDIKDFILSVTNFSQGIDTKNAPLWFLRNLAFYALISPILARVGVFKLFIFLCICFTFPVNIYNFNAFPNLFFNLHGIPIGLAFFIIGMLLRGWPLHKFESMLSSNKVIILLALIASVILARYFHLPFELGAFFTWLCSFCLLGIWLERGLVVLGLSNFIEPLVRSTFVSFACHYIIMQAIFKPYGITFSEDHPITLIAAVLSIYIFSFFITWLIELIIPKYSIFITGFPSLPTHNKGQVERPPQKLDSQ